MQEIRRLPDSELEVMKVVWDAAAPVTRSAIQSALHEKSWTTPTFQALLARLEEKGFLTHEKNGNTFVYTALIPCAEYLAVESRTALGRMFGGSPARLVAALHQTDSLTDADVDELYAYLCELKEGRL